jgi:Tol biopolymer transport system component
MKKVFVFALTALLLASCLPQNVQVPQSPLLSVLERKSGLIAYIGTDANMYVVDQSGRNPTQLTKDAVLPKNQTDPFLVYEFPTWSRDGSQLAFVGLKSDGIQAESKVMVANLDNNSVNQIYKSDTEHPVYVNWSPDNANVGFISTNVSQQNFIFQTVPAQGGDRTILDTGSPYYWSWAPDGRVLIVHAGGTAGSPEHVAFLNVDSKNVTEQGLELATSSTDPTSPQTFQAPAWSPDGSHIALARVTDKENQIVITDSAGENPKKIGTFKTKTAFAWSSDSTRLAYIDGKEALQAGTVGALHVYDLETSKEVVENSDIIAFFWSPNGEEIAYFILGQVSGDSSSGSGSPTPSAAGAQYVLELHVLNVTTGKSSKLFTYRPTQQFLNILPYFDQYHQSVTIWSPDNNNLVLSFMDSSGNPGVAVVAASGKLEPRILAEGYLGFWSWK